MAHANLIHMKTSFKRLSLVALVTLVVGVAAIELPHAGKTTHDLLVVEVPIETLGKEADVVISGTVLKQLGTIREIDATGNEMVYTRWSIKPEKELKGKAGKSIVVRTLGGQFLTTIVEVDDQPTFTVGERVILYARSVPEWKGDLRTVGEFQGKFSITGTAGSETAVQAETTERRSLQQLETEVSLSQE